MTDATTDPENPEPIYVAEYSIYAAKSGNTVVTGWSGWPTLEQAIAYLMGVLTGAGAGRNSLRTASCRIELRPDRTRRDSVVVRQLGPSYPIINAERAVANWLEATSPEHH